MNALEVQHVDAGYDNTIILQDFSVAIPKGKITILIGPNGCGKSTLLKLMGRILSPKKGTILLQGQNIQQQAPKSIAKQLALLPQSPITPQGLLVKELVAYGRFPYQKPFGSLQQHDLEIIEWAMHETGVLSQKDQFVETLSGGQRQRVWIAMALAQKTDIILLDEPTTYLDIAYQLEILELLQRSNKQSQQTIVMVLHELHLACRFADHIIALKHGSLLFEGTPLQMITQEHLQELYGINASIHPNADASYPLCYDYQLQSFPHTES